MSVPVAPRRNVIGVVQVSRKGLMLRSRRRLHQRRFETAGKGCGNPSRMAFMQEGEKFKICELVFVIGTWQLKLVEITITNYSHPLRAKS